MERREESGFDMSRIMNQIQVCVTLVEFHVTLGPHIELVYPETLPFEEKDVDKLNESFKVKLPFLALPDRADACDAGYCYFTLRQTPVLVMGVSCFRQIESDEAARHKRQRSLCVLCNCPVYDYIRTKIEDCVDDIIWMDSEEQRLDKLKTFQERLTREINKEIKLPPRIGSICSVTSLVNSLRWLGGGKPALSLLKCILLGNTGVAVSGPSGVVVSEIIVSLASVLPHFGEFVRVSWSDPHPHQASEHQMVSFSRHTKDLVKLSMLSTDSLSKADTVNKSKMLFMPYSSLMDLDDLRMVYVPRTSSESKKTGMEGRCGFFTGTVNPVIAAQIKRFGDLIVELSDTVVDEGWRNSKSVDGTSTPAPPPPPQVNNVVEESGSKEKEGDSLAASWAQFQRFSSKAAQMVKDKTDQVVSKIQKWASSPVTISALSDSGRIAADLGKKDRDFVKKIDRILYKPSGGGGPGLKQKSQSESATGSLKQRKLSKKSQSVVSSNEKMKQDLNKAQAKITGFFNSLVAQVMDHDEDEDDKQDHDGEKTLQMNHDERVDNNDDDDDDEYSGSEQQMRYTPLDLSEDEIDEKLREIFTEWLNSLFEEIHSYLNEVVLPSMKYKHALFMAGHNRAYLQEWCQITHTIREKKSSIEVVTFANGDEFRGELLSSVGDDFVDLAISKLKKLNSKSEDQQGSEKEEDDGDEEEEEEGHVDRQSIVRQGLGVYLSKRWRYEGLFVDDKRHGHGSVCRVGENDDSFIYDGDWENDMRHGIGTCIVKGKGQYSGQWKHDKFQGEGLLFDAHGNSYQGSWVNGKREGEGTWTSGKSGESFQGTWEGGKPSGIGNATYIDESKYCGHWVDGKRQGHGAWSKSSSEFFDGVWECDEKHGKGSLVCDVVEEEDETNNNNDTKKKKIEVDGYWVQDRLDVTNPESKVIEYETKTIIYEGALSEWPALGSLPSWVNETPTLNIQDTWTWADFMCDFKLEPTESGKQRIVHDEINDK